MLASRYPHVFVAACDMPGLDATSSASVLGRIGDADAVVPRWDGDVEPLHAVYAVRALARRRGALASGRNAMRDFLQTVRVVWVDEAELRALRGAAASLTNVNTPEDLAGVGGRFEES
jgi:molybdopterin-guanine dinucleotide biosynthesis protein A